MQVLSSIADVRKARATFGALGFVPTMGFLHEGHLSLVERAKAECGAVAVSIFVNPTQFAPHEDLGRYPRDMPRDLALLQAAGVDFVFTPEPAEIYPAGFETSINVGPVTTVLEGAIRPGHFAGVATVVTKLFNIVQPSRAYFGQKDAQQCVVIWRMVRDLDMPLDVVIGPTVRDPDGLAMSSRNTYLTTEERAVAPAIYRALNAARDARQTGETLASKLRELITATLNETKAFEIDYVSVADADSLVELDTVNGPALISLAARLGKTRLIDNIILD
jgi:pantoate--beta-alanine ligase